ADRVERFAGRFDAVTDRLDDAAALERAARELIEKFQDGARKVEAAQSDVGLAEQMSAFRRERAAAERRTEAILQGIQDVLDRLIDRLPREGAGAPAAGRPQDGRERAPDVPAIDPSRLSDLDETTPRDAAARRGAGGEGERTVWPGEGDDEVLLEPGADGPHHLASGATLGPRSHPSVSAHIAAARRAAQSAVSDNGRSTAGASWPRVEGTVRRTRQILARRKRSFALAAALALAVAAAAVLMSVHGPLMRKSERNEAPVKTAETQLVPPTAAGAAEAPSLDRSPTGSLGRGQAVVEGPLAAGPAAAELSAALPNGVASSLREAVLAGSPAAEYDLAQRLLDGRGLPQNQAAAAAWFERAASAGFAPAQFRLAALYQKGVGVPHDPAAAKRWYMAAAQAGNARAAHNLGVIEAEPTDGKADYAEAAKWFRRAAEMGVRDSQFNLAVLYARGLGVAQDLRQSWMWFSLAAAQGDAEAARKRDEVAERMDPDALAAAADLLSKFKAVEPDPSANDVAGPSAYGSDKSPRALPSDSRLARDADARPGP
ncbi:MAG TPA: tetratricopeptide repeat protein, partial [Roseiarcus sp.]|nr:tetratricopeptide repeat protein [Roseiarcus sp.]